jgi:DNA-binding protein HU-beta
MNRVQLAQQIANKHRLSRKQAEEILETAEAVIIATLKKGEEVTLAGFGSFEPKTRKGRDGVNPRNVREKIVIPPVRVAKFRVGKNLKEAMKK